jgi:nucleoside phosphorylase
MTHNYGKTGASGVFQQTGVINKPPQMLLSSTAWLYADEILGNNQSIVGVISHVLNANVEMKSPRPANEPDRLFDPAYDHPQSEDSCDKKELIFYIETRTSNEPQIHYGLIASRDQVMKHGRTRDRLAKEYGILCFEMEAAGLMDQLPCLVIRGICYCDSHKNEQWQGYAALTEVAYAKILLSVFSVN